MAMDEIRASLEEAVAFLQGGVQRAAMEPALNVIETWEQRLAASDSPELTPISDNLAALRVQLLAGDADPAAIGQLLKTLGDQVQEVSESEVGAPVAERLSDLAALLTQQGEGLVGGR